MNLMKDFYRVDIEKEVNLMPDNEANSISFFCKKSFNKIDNVSIKQLEKLSNENGSARICLHHNVDDNLHDMVIVEKFGRYCKPHFHINNDETIHIISGALIIVIFDENGGVLESGILRKNELIRIEKKTYHTVTPLTEYVAYHESKSGPFRRNETVSAKWSPLNGSLEGENFVKDIVTRFVSKK